MPEEVKKEATENHVSVGISLRAIRAALEQMTIQGGRNAALLLGCCNDLDKLIAKFSGDEQKGGGN